MSIFEAQKGKDTCLHDATSTMASVEPELKFPPLLSHESQLQNLQNTPISQADRGTWMLQILESITSLSCRAKSFNNLGTC